jgi:hypothetical protein
VPLGERVADGVEVTVETAVCADEPVPVCVAVLVRLFDAEDVCVTDAVPEIVIDDDGVLEAVKDGVPVEDGV